MTPALSATKIRKAFGATVALDGVDVEVRAGEVLALLGENGAGKSTLLGVLSGSIAPDGGVVALAGAPVHFRDAGRARAAGVALVHQELSLFPHLSVTDNLLAGAEARRFGWLDARARRARARQALARVGRELDLDARVGELPIADRQLVEIARALISKPKILLLDEPTSSLASDEVERLFALVAALRSDGLAIVYISHFLEEVRRVADRFVVLRDGRTVATGTLATTPDDALLAAMVGRRVDELYPPRGRRPGDVVLRARRLASPPRLVRASLELRAGEIVGIAGLVGAGRTELVRALAGLDVATGGTLELRGRRLEATAAAARMRAGIGYLSEDRKGEGLAIGLSVADNVTLSSLASVSRAGFVSRARQRAAVSAQVAALGIRCASGEQPVGALSGGNQQKVALARLLHAGSDVLLLDEPTRGVDVGSKVALYAAIDAAARAGKAVLVTSSYLPELLGLADRIAVVCRGVLSAARPTEAWTPESIAAVATGAMPIDREEAA